MRETTTGSKGRGSIRPSRITCRSWSAATAPNSSVTPAPTLTDDRAAALATICDEVEGLAPDHAGAIPYLLVGTVDDIVAHLVQCRERWAITYFVVRELEFFAPILDVMT